MTTIMLRVFGIVVHREGGSGSITSDLRGTESDDYWDGIVDAIESMVLAHSIAGIDIASPAYIEGLETAVESASNNATVWGS